METTLECGVVFRPLASNAKETASSTFQRRSLAPERDAFSEDSLAL